MSNFGAAASNSSDTGGSGSSGQQNEDDLRKELRAAQHSLNRREPLEPNYKRLLLNGLVTSRRPTLPKDKFYKRVGSRLRERVEQFMALTEGKDPLDRIAQREAPTDEAMRAALTLREAKDHEQQILLDATLAAMPHRNGMDEMTRKRHFEGIAMTLQSREKKKTYRSLSPQPSSAAEQTEQARQAAELERQRAQARAREAARKKREEDERKAREEEMFRKRKAETPQQSLQKLYQPIFKKLWDMEFSNLGNINPFRIVIDKSNCAHMGAPDYFDVITTPVRSDYYDVCVLEAALVHMQIILLSLLMYFILRVLPFYFYLCR